MSFSTRGFYGIPMKVKVVDGGTDELGYGHQPGELTFSCERCENDKVPILSCDSSNGEYSKINLCKECILNLFEEHESKSI